MAMAGHMVMNMRMMAGTIMHITITTITIINRNTSPMSDSSRDMMMNNHQPEIEVHPETYEVRADGELLTCEPAEELPMAQRYFLF